MSSCLNDYIGLSKRDCSCPDFANKPTDNSVSGFHVDTDMVFAQDLAYGDCGDGTIWDVLQGAKDLAILETESDFSAELGKLYRNAVTPFAGNIGKYSATVATDAKAINGISIETKGLTGFKIIIKSLQIGITTGGSTTVKFWRNEELVYTENVTLLSNQLTSIVLATPFQTRVKEGDKYYISYELPTNAYPFSTTVSCNCPSEDNSWKKMLSIGGFSVANEANIYGSSQSISSYGVIVNMLIFCGVTEWFCKLAEFGTASEAYMILARALSYKAGAIATEKLLNSTLISFSSLISKEMLYGARNKFLSEYSRRLQYLASIFPQNEYNCLACNEKSEIRRKSLIL